MDQRWSMDLVCKQKVAAAYDHYAIINTCRLVGLNYHTIYDGLYIFDADKKAWLPEDPPSHDASDSHSVLFKVGMAVLGICLGMILLVGSIWFCKRRRRKAKGSLLSGIKRMIWHPRYI